jgi:hypothetical protein
VDTPNNPPEPPFAKSLNYRQTRTIEQRVARLERLLLLFMVVATIMAVFTLAMIWAFLRITHQI